MASVDGVPQASTSTAVSGEASNGPAAKTTTIPIRLTSRADKHAIPESKFMVPSDWRRFQLSELINKVLDTEQPVPFDFLIGEELLRTSLGGFTESKGLTEESILEIEYVESILPPKSVTTLQHDDWISDVDLNASGQFLTSSYDASIRLYSASSSKPQHILSGHTLAVLSTCWLPGRCIASGGMDRNIRVWQLGSSESSSKPTASHALVLHTSPVSSVRAITGDNEGDASRKRLISAGWDGLVGYWDFALSQTSADDASDEEDESGSKRFKKRRKAEGVALANESITKVRPALVLRSHAGQVSRALLDSGSNGSKGYSFGLDDHAVREWDLASGGMESNTKQSDKAIMDADQLASRNLFVTGNGDKTVTLFDMREENSIISMTLTGHSSSVASVSAHPTSPLLFCSASYDSTVRIWDARSPKQALFAVKSQSNPKLPTSDGKLLCAAWDGNLIATGGENSQLELIQSKAV